MAPPQKTAQESAAAASNGQAQAFAPDALVQALYRPMRTAQTIDRIEQELCAAGEAFFQIAGLGHEAAAALNLFLKPEDWLHPHYRDKALMVARGVEPKAWFDSVLTNADSYSAGRQMCCFMARYIPIGSNDQITDTIRQAHRL